jgi:hypothetical protein
VEYEWKQPFCTKCNKVSHECNVNKQQTKKQQEKKVWTAKPDKNIVTPPPGNTTDTGSIHKENAEAHVNESVAATWTVVGSANKHKGKEIRVAGKELFGCKNGFEVLRIGECSLTSDDKVP